MAWIKRSESVSRLLISVVHHRSDGWGGWLWPGAWGLALTAARHGRARRLAGVRVFSSYGSWFPMRFSTMGSQQRGERDYANLKQRRAAMVWRLGRWLATVRAASVEALALRTCAKASSSSLLASRSTNCFEWWWKTRIWWLPRVRQVLDLRSKIQSICGAIYRGF
jgi:hypothetical protein